MGDARTLSEATLLDVLTSLASQPDSADSHVLECARDTLTYRQLWLIASGLAADLTDRYGPRPIVAIVSENHPYIFALIMGIWMAGGTVAPLDVHAPRTLMQGMLSKISPDCVVMPSTDEATQAIAHEMAIKTHPFQVKSSTIPALLDQFGSKSFHSPINSGCLSPDDIAFYMFTSSASSAENLKAVSVSHRSLYTNCLSQITWLRAAYPEQSFDKLRLLGWAPWSHTMGTAHDIATCTLLTGGCYIIAITPSTYPDVQGSVSGDVDIRTRLRDALLTKSANAFGGVPWVLEGMMKLYKDETDAAQREQFNAALKQLNIYISAGAEPSEEIVQWCGEVGIPLALVIGMTELGGALFYGHADTKECGWPVDQCIIPDAILTLIDDQGDEDANEGELYVKSKLISRGYLKCESTAFTVDPDGWVTLRTGDIYARTESSQIPRLRWKGRKEDYVQLVSGEVLDPRVVEKTLNASSAISRSCLVGNMFLQGRAQHICLIIEPNLEQEIPQGVSGRSAELVKAVAGVNRDLPPPLRIAWSRILVLSEGEKLPLTRKGDIFRKKLSSLFGERLAALLGNPSISQLSGPSIKQTSPGGVTNTVLDILCSSLGLSRAILEDNRECTFAELGMDSTMAIAIVNNLNRRLGLDLPPNTCHVYIDLQELTDFVVKKLGLTTQQTERVPLPAASLPTNILQEVVIIGQSLRLPGQLNSPESFWKALVDQRDDILTSIPPERWDQASFYRDGPGSHRPGGIRFNLAGFIDLASFDNNFFGIPGPEALTISPTARLTMEVAFDALEDANIPLSAVRGTDMAVFVAIGPEDGYNQLLFLQDGFEAYTRFYGTGVSNSTACGRLSYLLDVHGPSITIDTACSGGLVALDQAVRHLQHGEGESAIVCGINTHLWPGMFSFISAQQMTSPNGRCATFSTDADGYATSEGAVSFVLKTRAAALRDGDNILGTVKASAVQHNGRSQGLVAPNVRAQVSLQQALLRKSGLMPSDVDLIESHGTGTHLGDLVEIQAISEVFTSSHSPSRPLVIGASKTCIGHTESAAGLVGVAKTLLSFEHNLVPGLVHLTDSNLSPEIDCKSVPMVIPYQQVPIHSDKAPDDETPFRAMVLAYGFAGTISGAVVESELTSPRTQITDANIRRLSSPEHMVFVVSAKSQQALRKYMETYIEFCGHVSSDMFHSICYTSCVGREHYKYRFACVAQDLQDLIEKLKTELSLKKSIKASPSRARLILGFPGQGSQYQGMARELASQNSEFKSILLHTAEQATTFAHFPVASLLLESNGPSDISVDESRHAQVCIFVYQYSICKWLETLNICPNALLGHSIGEIAAAVIGGALTLELGLEFVILRAQMLQPNPDRPAAMAAVAASHEDIVAKIKGMKLQEYVVVAVYNGKQSHVISGEAWAVESLVDSFKTDGSRALKLNIDQGFHSPCILPCLPPLQEWLQRHESQLLSPSVSFYSTMLGQELNEGQRLDTQYWLDHAQYPVRFAQTAALIQEEQVSNIILDVGPQPTMWTSLQSSLNPEKTTAFACCAKQGKNQDLAVLSALAGLFRTGITPNFSKLYAQRRHRFSKTKIPTYPWQRQRHFPSVIPSRNAPSAVATQISSQQRTDTWSVNSSLYDLLDNHRIQGRRVLPGAAFAVFVALSSANPSPKSVAALQFHKPLVLDTTDAEIHARISGNGTFTITYEVSGSSDKICSGLVGSSEHTHPVPTRQPMSTSSPLHVLDKHDAYSVFKHVNFGSLFQNIDEVSFWDDHADGSITVEMTGDPVLDRIRQLDACLHMFGAVQKNQFPDTSEPQLDGAFLPSSLNNFVMHVAELPATFVCRYHLPIHHERNHHLMYTSLEVLSHAGDVLVTCEKYSVAWIPFESVPSKPKVESISQHRLSYAWLPQPLAPIVAPDVSPDFENLVVIGMQPHLASLPIQLLQLAQKTTLIDIAHSREDFSVSAQPITPSGDQTDKYRYHSAMELTDILVDSKSLIVLDTTAANFSQMDDLFNNCRNLIAVLKILADTKMRVEGFVVISSMAAFVTSPDVENVIEGAPGDIPSFALGSVAHSMISVWRRECGLGSSVVWGLDLPCSKAISDIDVGLMIKRELQARRSAKMSPSLVGIRVGARDGTIMRLVPVLRPVSSDSIESVSCTGITVITGMGNIGQALVRGAISSGASGVVFLGRTIDSDERIIDELSGLRRQYPDIPIDYLQADVSDLTCVVDVLKEICEKFGPITAIVHTAGVVKDALVGTISPEMFNEVAKPKILGGWNLHIASMRLSLPIQSFVLLSSISVALSTPGQIAYVAGNSFLDSLASFRRSFGLPGLSVQLGAWESKMIENVALATMLAIPAMQPADGVSLIMEAVKSGAPVQLIAKLNLQRFSSAPHVAQDPLFGELLADIRNDTSPGFKSLAGPPDVETAVSAALHEILELDEELDLSATLGDIGVDSIAFAQFSGHIMKDFSLELPMIFFSDAFSIHDIIVNLRSRLQETLAAGDPSGKAEITSDPRPNI